MSGRNEHWVQRTGDERAAHASRRVLKPDPQASQSQVPPAARAQAVVAETDPLALRAARLPATRPHADDHDTILEARAFDDPTAEFDEAMQ